MGIARSGNRIVGLVAAAGLAAALCAGAAGAQEPTQSSTGPGAVLALTAGRAEVLRYDSTIGTVIVGDPAVAAASVAQSDSLVLTGIGAGETNVIVLDEAGDEMDRIVLSIPPRGWQIVIWHGTERDVLSCERFCRPADGAAETGATQ